MSVIEPPAAPVPAPVPVPAPAPAPATERCPACGAPVAVHERFPAWCPACEWNLLPPVPPAGARTGRARRRAAREARRTERRRQDVRERAEQVFRLVAAGGSGLRHGASVGAFLLAGAVHLVSLAVLLTGVALLAGWPVASWPLRVLGAVALAVAVLLRPRLGRPERTGVLARADAPVLYELVDRVSAELGAPRVDSIAVTDEFNAAFGTYGLRRHRQLRIGLPLWTVLERQERVAMLGHEIGHGVNGDTRRGLWTGSALNALVEWYRLTVPSRDHEVNSHPLTAVASAAAKLLLGAVNLGVRALAGLMHRLHLRSGQAAEYRADLMGARLASARDAQGVLTALFNAQTLETVLVRQRALPRAGGRAGGRAGRSAAPVADLWTALAEAARSVPATEVERRVRLSEREVTATDSSHPPTYLRLRMLATAAPAVDRPTLVLDAGRAAAIEAELAPSRARVAAELL
ncbi:M48 family metalloprotease [Kitasatospora sp. NPDC088783]|uniref:M48 family metalloprotease n=1 Tax=Kitasatospora sp. NPDC088783 TaxID=3364077 RepID=UPI0037F85F03